MLGTTVSHYKIIEKLGGGGMGVVYKAHDTRLDRPVALKFLPPDLTRDSEARERFIHEAKAASALQHPNICTIHDIDETADKQLFIVMDCYEGEALKQMIDRGPLPIDKAIDIATQIAQGLAKAHESGIVHRDIKPANIMIGEDGIVRIVDFGLAKLSKQTVLTKTGSTVGTAAYMSPEQARGERVDHRTDVWSFGVVLYEMLTGKRPFDSEYEQALVFSIVNQDPRPMKELRPDVPEALGKIVRRAMAKDANDRYQTAAELISDLESIRLGTGLSLKTRKAIIRRRKFVYAGAFALIGTAAVLYVFLPTKQAPTKDTSIAVLPFKNFSDTKGDEYFSDGVTEEIIANLSKISGLKVTSRTSTERYKNTAKSLRDIAQELGVGHILEGSVRRAGTRVRITGQLIDANSDQHIWAENYEREMRDVFDVQADVAEKIAEALRGRLSSEEILRLEARPAQNVGAYDLYLRGRFEWRHRTQEGLKNAVKYFQQAVQLDPSYARAYVGLADCYVLYSFYRVSELSQEEAYARAEQNARIALDINPQLAEAHASLGNVLKRRTWDWRGSEMELRRAIQIDPQYATARQWYAELVNTLGRYEEGLVEARKSTEIEPFSPVLWNVLGGTFVKVRQYDSAIVCYRRASALDAEYSTPHSGLARVYRLKNMWPEAAAELHQAGAPPEVCETYLAVGIDPKQAAARLQSQAFSGEWRIVLVEVYVDLDLKDKAFELLDILVRERETKLPDLLRLPTLDPIRQDPRFNLVLRKLGLEK